MPSTEPIAKRLKKLREARHLTIKEAATLIGVPQTTYREWEYGRAIRGEPYIRIAKAFNISLDELFGCPKSHPELYDKELEKIIEDVDKISNRLSYLKNKKILFLLFSLVSMGKELF